MAREWHNRERERLAAFVTPDAIAWVPDVIGALRGAYTPTDKVAVARQAYEALATLEIDYDLETYHPSSAIQRIRTPHEICAVPRAGTCLDLAILFAGVCLACDLIPVLVITGGHAFVMLAAKRSLREWNAYDRSEYPRFTEALVQDEAFLQGLVTSGDYLAIETTGYARARPDTETLSFDEAVREGRTELESMDGRLQFALDVSVARYDWQIEAMPLLAPTLRRDVDLELPTQRLPNNLPRDIAITGRNAEITQIISDLAREVPSGRQAVLAIDAVDGMPGIGKTALAVHVAHRLAHAYPDAQLFVDLHGYTIGQEPTGAIDALGSLLRSLGTQAQSIASTLDDRAAQWRAALADKRAVIVLDNARTAQQVRPLLPGAPGCRVLVTSRRRLTGLEGVHSVSLKCLSASDAERLFVSVIGSERVEWELGQVKRVVELCGYLPLAVQLAANRLRYRTAWSVEYFGDQLAEARTRLSALHAEDVGVTAAFELSYRELLEGERAAYRRLGLYEGRSFSQPVAAALIDSTAEEAGRLLGTLFDHNLIEEPTQGRYQFHDLLHQYARDLAAHEDSKEDRGRTVLRLCNVYLGTAIAADRFIDPHRQMSAPSTFAAPTSEHLSFANRIDALSWMEEERSGLVATALQAGRGGFLDYACAIPAAMAAYLLARAYTREALELHEVALRSSLELGDERSEATARENLGSACWEAGKFAEALDYFDKALTASRRTELKDTEARILDKIAFTYERTGLYPRARECLAHALSLRRGLNDPFGEAKTLNTLGAVNWREGQYEQALQHFGDALELRRSLGDEYGEGRTLNNIGLTYQRLGKYDEALSHLTMAEEIASRLGDRHVLSTIAVNFSYTKEAMGNPEEALEHATDGLEIAREIGSAYEEARALDASACACAALGRTEPAAEQWTQAHILFRDLGCPEGEEVRIRLNELALAARRENSPDPRSPPAATRSAEPKAPT